MSKKAITIICMQVLFGGSVFAGFGLLKKNIFDAFVAKEQATFQKAMEAAARDPSFPQGEVARWAEKAYIKKGLVYTPTQETLLNQIIRAMDADDAKKKKLFSILMGNYVAEGATYDLEALKARFLAEQETMIKACSSNLDLASDYLVFFREKLGLQEDGKVQFRMILERAGLEYGTKAPEETAIGKADSKKLSTLAIQAAMSGLGVSESITKFYTSTVIQAVIQSDVEAFDARLGAFRSALGETSIDYTNFLAGSNTELQQRIMGYLNVKILNVYIRFWEEITDAKTEEIKAFMKRFLEQLEFSVPRVKKIEEADYSTLNATAGRYNLGDITDRLDAIRSSG